MKITINAQKLKDTLENASATVAKTNQNQLLKGIYFQTEGNSVCIRSTNVSTGYEKVLLCSVVEEGSFVVLAEVIMRVFSSVSFGSETVCEISLVENVCHITIGKHRIEVKTLPSEGFPTLPDVVGEKLSLPAEKLVYGLKSVIFSVAKTEIKPEISGVYIYGENKETLTFVGTDSYRLSEKKLDVQDVLDTFQCIIPEKNAKDIIKIFNEHGGNFEIVFSKNSLSLRTESEYFVTRLIEGKFPNYKQIIPATSEAQSILLKDDIVKSLKIVSYFSDKTEQVTLECLPETMNVFAQNFEVGSATESINNTLKGEAFTIKVNSRYFEEFLSQVREQSIIIKYTSQNKPIIFQGIEDISFTYLVMPSYR